jgi:hypothetical protein
MLKQYWAKKRQANLDKTAQGLVYTIQVGRRIQVTCPDNDDFTRGAKELGGIWRDRTQLWSFPIERKRLVRDLVIQCFGMEDIQ